VVLRFPALGRVVVVTTPEDYATSFFNTTGDTAELDQNDNYRKTTIAWLGEYVTVQGRFKYVDPIRGVETVSPCTRAFILESDVGQGSADDTLAIVWVDGNGVFQSPPLLNYDADVGGGHLDIYVRQLFESREPCWNLAYTANKGIVSMRKHDWSRWYLETSTVIDVPSGATVFPDVIATAYGECAALRIHDVLTHKGWGWVKDHGGLTDSLVVLWEPGVEATTQTLYGVPGQANTPRRMTINGAHKLVTFGPDELDDAVLLHEYGHHVAFEHSFEGFDPETTPFSGPDAAQSNPIRSWREGWADFYGAFRQRYSSEGEFPIFRNTADSAGVSIFYTLDLERGLVFRGNPGGDSTLVAVANSAGPLWDVAVAGTLWDVYDSADDNPNVDSFADRWTDGIDRVWDTLVQTGAIDSTICSFQTSFDSLFNDVELQPDRFLQSRDVFREHGMRCSTDSLSILTGVEVSRAAPHIRLSVVPNPVGSATDIRLRLAGDPGRRRVTMAIFDVAGRHVRTLVDGPLMDGEHRIGWDGRTAGGVPVAGGVYAIRVTVGDASLTRKLVVLR
jgi:hypothetical protein